MFQLLLTQTLTHAFRRGGGAFGTCAFYIIIVTLFTFALGPEAIHVHAGAVLCVAMLLSSITALPLFFERDYEDGTLEQYVLWPVALEWLMFAKIIGHWLSIILPILLVSPVMMLFASLDPEGMVSVIWLLLLASPDMVAIGAISAALTIGTKRGGLLQALVTLPLYIPILIFAASDGGQGALLFLMATALAAIPLACLVCASLVKMSLD